MYFLKGSMTHNWKFLKDSLQQSFELITKANKLNTVSIINFSTTAFIEISNADPNKINVNVLVL